MSTKACLIDILGMKISSVNQKTMIRLEVESSEIRMQDGKIVHIENGTILLLSTDEFTVSFPYTGEVLTLEFDGTRVTARNIHVLERNKEVRNKRVVLRSGDSQVSFPLEYIN